MNPAGRIRQEVLLVPQRLVFAFPLLARELTEMSARRRTYILRTVYAVVLYVMAGVLAWSEIQGWTGVSFQFLGRGRMFFDGLAIMQFCGLYLFLPAMTSGALTIEKERDTLSLLLLTRLGPWSILIGKLFSRLVPMATFLLLSLPLVTVAYSLGGVNEVDILSLAWTLAVTALQVAAFSLACSAWCRTTAGSFLATYLLGALVVLGPALFFWWGQYDSLGILDFLREYCEQRGMTGTYPLNREDMLLLLFGPWAVLGNENVPFAVIVRRTVPILLSATAFLVFARAVLWKRAFLKPSNLLLALFRSLDTVFHRLNQNSLTRGIVLTSENVTLPKYDPIRWRETKKRSLGTTRYLIRLLLVLEFPLMFAMLVPHHRGTDSWDAPAYMAAWGLWVVAVLVIAIQSSGLIGSERSRQTLDVLLTTPLWSDAIVREKFAGVWRLIRTLWIPFVTVYLFQLWWFTWEAFGSGNQITYGFFRGLLATAIFLPLVAWIGFHFGVWCRSQAQALLLTLTVIVGVCVIPMAVGETVWYLGITPLYELRWLSPAAVIISNPQEYRIMSNGRYYNLAASVWIGTIVHFILAGGLLFVLWYGGLKTFARRVSRNDGMIIDDDDIDRLAMLRQKIVGGPR
ncbi:MAG: ABC transporter permease subunit [Planctomycetes bacterium]|nr:ABC transporter permease subunit [Planctomycetota bacterium]